MLTRVLHISPNVQLPLFPYDGGDVHASGKAFKRTSSIHGRGTAGLSLPRGTWIGQSSSIMLIWFWEFRIGHYGYPRLDRSWESGFTDRGLDQVAGSSYSRPTVPPSSGGLSTSLCSHVPLSPSPLPCEILIRGGGSKYHLCVWAISSVSLDLV